MKIFGYELGRKEEKSASFEEVLRRLASAYEKDTAGVAVTPDNAMQSPTVHAIVTAISNRIATLPLQVMKKVEKNGRTVKVMDPDHPINALLKSPNEWQTGFDFWQDAVSCLVRWGNFYAVKLRGASGPYRGLIPVHPSNVNIRQSLESGKIEYRIAETGGGVREYDISKILHIRGPARDFITGDSPCRDVARAIGLEIAAEKFGSTFFANGAMPLLVFQYMQGTSGFKTREEQQEFINSFQDQFGDEKRHRAMLLPKGIETGKDVRIENDKAQFLETRRLQRQIIAGAFNVPAHFVGATEQSTFNNIEQQSLDFIITVVLPNIRRIEAALEDSLLSPQERNSGYILRFNLDAALRGDFKSRQEGLKIMREWGVINPNDWREMENMNPISDEDGGEDFVRPMNMSVPGEEPEGTPQDASEDTGNQDAESSTSA